MIAFDGNTAGRQKRARGSVRWGGRRAPMGSICFCIYNSSLSRGERPSSWTIGTKGKAPGWHRNGPQETRGKLTASSPPTDIFIHPCARIFLSLCLLRRRAKGLRYWNPCWRPSFITFTRPPLWRAAADNCLSTMTTTEAKGRKVAGSSL